MPTSSLKFTFSSFGALSRSESAAEEPQRPELKAQLQRDFEPLRTQRDAAGAGAFGADRVIDEGEI